MEYVAVEALKRYNGGIMFVSYLVAVAGAQTTLELLNRRTHITGLYNWYYKLQLQIKKKHKTYTPHI